MSNKDVIDLWSNIDFKLDKEKLVIKGPINKNMERLNLEFIYDESNNKLFTLQKTNSYNNIELIFHKDVVIIENLSKSDIYRGSEYMILALQIIYKLGYKTVKLKDNEYFVCDRKMNFFSNKDNIINNPNKLIYLLRFGGTFYMPFGFIPILTEEKLLQVNLNTTEKNLLINLKYEDYKNISKIIELLLQSLFIISWSNINDYILGIEKLLNNNIYKISNRIFNWRVSNYNKWKIYWKNICKSWKIFNEKYSSLVSGPFYAFSLYDKKECELFINWLELYSFSINQTIEYNSSIFNNKLSEKNTLIGINNFKKLKLLLEKAEWLNFNITYQPIKSIYTESI